MGMGTTLCGRRWWRLTHVRPAACVSLRLLRRRRGAPGILLAVTFSSGELHGICVWLCNAGQAVSISVTLCGGCGRADARAPYVPCLCCDIHSLARPFMAEDHAMPTLLLFCAPARRRQR